MNRLYWKQDVFGVNVPRLPFEILGLLVQAAAERKYERKHAAWERHYKDHIDRKNMEAFKREMGF